MIAAASIVTATVTLSFFAPQLSSSRCNRYGLVDACLAGAGVFLVATLALLGIYAIYVARRRREAQARAALEPPALSALADPRVILAGLQIVQAIGFKRLLLIFAIAGVAFALASRPHAQQGLVLLKRPKEVQQILLVRDRKHVEIVDDRVGLRCSGRRARPAAMLTDRHDQIRRAAVM